MNEAIYAAQAEFLITIIGLLIPLLIWAFRDAERWLTTRRAHSSHHEKHRLPS